MKRTMKPAQIARAQEQLEFRVYLDGFIHYAKGRNLLFGKPIKPQAEWDKLSDAEKETAVMAALASLDPRRMAIFMNIAHEAITEELQRRARQ
jgi:hypothetical protein